MEVRLKESGCPLRATARTQEGEAETREREREEEDGEEGRTKPRRGFGMWRPGTNFTLYPYNIGLGRSSASAACTVVRT